MNISLRIWAMICCVASAVGAVETTPAKDLTTFTDALGQIEVGLPPIGSEIVTSERVLAPQLTKELRFVSKEGSAAVLVSTRIRPDIPHDDRVLERVEPKYRNFKQEHEEGDVIVQFRGRSPDRTLEFAVAGGEYQEAFPYVVGGLIGTEDPPKSITISQFFVTSDRMFEAAIFLTNDDKSSKADLFTRARKVCDEWRLHIVVKE